MYSSDVTEALVREHQRAILARIVADRRVHAAQDEADCASVATGHRSRPHPMAAFHAWLAAGQL